MPQDTSTSSPTLISSDDTFVTQRCSACGEHKPAHTFAYKNKATGRRQTKCKPCTRAYSKGHYEANKDDYLEKAQRHNAKYRERNQRHVDRSLEGQACTDCDASQDLLYYSGAYEKGQAVHLAVHSALSVEAVQEAIDRSHVICRSCLQQHFARGIRPWALLSSLERKVEQRRREAVGFKPRPRSVFKAYQPRAKKAA